MACKACGSRGLVGLGNGQTVACPVCAGTGQDPGLFFVYAVETAGALAGNGAVTLAIQVLDHSFRVWYLVATSTGAFTALISDLGGKRPFSNIAVHSANLFGTAQNPFPLVVPYVFQKRGQIAVALTDLSGAGNTIRLAFVGAEVND